MNTQNRSAEGVSRKGFWSRCGDAASKKLWPLDRDALSAAARRRTGLADFGDPAIESRLAILAKSIESEADLHPLGRLLASIHLGDLLKTRLRLEETWRKKPGFEAEGIQRPVFITGMPRSGSTFLHEVLAQDTDNRAPRVWEVMSPLPTGAKRRICGTAACLWWFRQIAPAADSVHPIRATTPHECVAIQSYTLLSREFVTTFRVPTYEAFLDKTDFDPAYAWEKRFLQYLQWQQPARRWVLKAPDHMFNMEGLLRVFPDAAIIQTHRNPLEVIESSSRLTEVVQRTFARPQEWSEIGIREARVLADGLDRITRFREAHPELEDRFVDVNYDDLISDPLKTVRRLYRELNLPLTPATVERVQSLARSRSRYGGQRTRPGLAELDIDSGMKTRFASYCARFNVRQAERGGA
jgi:hypothetical protein